MQKVGTSDVQIGPARDKRRFYLPFSQLEKVRVWTRGLLDIQSPDFLQEPTPLPSLYAAKPGSHPVDMADPAELSLRTTPEPGERDDSTTPVR